MINQADRLAFSLYQATAPAQIKGIMSAQNVINTQLIKAQAIDTANYNLFVPSNTLISEYQHEYNYIDGNIRTDVTEQNIVDSANKVLNNYFFPNNTQSSVVPLAPNNIWTRIPPFALSAGLGFPYSGAFPTPSATAEIPLIATILAFDMSTPQPTIDAAVSSYLATLAAEKTAVQANTDTNSTNQAHNTAAIAAINATISALNSYSGLAQLQSDVTTRHTFLTSTREPQLNAILGSISQNLSTGAITSSSGLYGQRYSFIALRLNALNGSLTVLSSLQVASNAQTSIIANIQSTSATYYSILPTSTFKSNANGTPFISLNDVSFLSPGDHVYVVSDNQTELYMVVKTVVGNAVTLNDIVPAKYTISNNVRLYKDLT